jgi:hypothetical protein
LAQGAAAGPTPIGAQGGTSGDLGTAGTIVSRVTLDGCGQMPGMCMKLRFPGLAVMMLAVPGLASDNELATMRMAEKASMAFRKIIGTNASSHRRKGKRPCSSFI